MTTRWTKFIFLGKILVVVLPAILLLVLIKKDLVLNGRVEFFTDFLRPTATITELFPANRVIETDESTQKIIQEPVYFDVRLPQSFENAELEITYKTVKLPLLQVGLMTGEDNVWSYDFHPLFNEFLNNLNWFKLEFPNGTLWQKEKRFLSWSGFERELDRLTGLATYFFKTDRKFSLPDYQPATAETVINKTIRGSHSFYTYIKNEQLNFIFTVQDMNRADGPDPLRATVMNNNGQVVLTALLNDDGFVSRFDPASPRRQLVLKADNLSEGAYLINLECNDDIFFREIRTKQRYITFINRLYLVDNIEYGDGLVDLNYQPTVVYSTAARLGFQTAHPNGLQTVGLGAGQVVELTEIHKTYFVTPNILPTEIMVPKNDIKIFGRGAFALSSETYFNPEVYNLPDALITPDTNYFLTNYQTPTALANGFVKSKVNFALQNANVVNRKLRFAISAPELNNGEGELVIKSIKVVLTKKPLTTNELVAKAIKYFKERF